MPFSRALTFLLGLVVYLSISFAWAQGGWSSWSGKVTMGGNDAFHAQTGIHLVIVDPTMGLNPTRLKVRNGTKQPITVASPETTISEFEVAMGAEREIPLNPLKKGEYYTQIGVSVRYWQGPTPEELAQQQAAAQEKQAQEAKRAAEAQQQETNRRRQLAEKGQAQRKEFYDRKMAMVRQRNQQIDQSMSSLAGALVANMTQNKLQEQNQTIERNLAQIRDGKMDACPSCDGIGFEDCSCGDGRQTCMACMGQGRVYGGAQCVTCQGSGRQFCMQCGGTLRVECGACHGVGGVAVQKRTSTGSSNQSQPSPEEQKWLATLNLGYAAQKLGGTENLKLASVYYQEALKIGRQLYPNGIHDNLASTLYCLGMNYQMMGGPENLKRAIGHFEGALEIYRQLKFQGGIVISLGNLAFLRLFVGEYAQALAGAREALIMAPNDTWIHANEAHALLLLGEEELAKAIYLKYRNEKFNNHETFRDAVLGAFTDFRKAGIDHPGFARMEALLKEP